MSGEKSITSLISGMNPSLNDGDYVFCSVTALDVVNGHDVIGSFRETEGWTVIVERRTAQQLGLPFDFVAAWITLTVHSALDAVGLTATFATALSNEGISCNVIAAFYHDHIFVAKEDAHKAMQVLHALAKSERPQ